jgi:hypothetical protein
MTREQCSFSCDTDRSVGFGSPPLCWHTEDPLDICTSSANNGPDPNYPDHTPIRYMKTVLHIFQQEDPDSLGQWKIHPTDPRNFIDTATHLALFSSWFNDSGGANDFLSKLCDDPTDASPHMEDARFRFLNTGTVGVDIFFHPDNRGWGIGAANCPNDSINSGEGGNFTYRSDAIKNYITSPSSSNPDYSALIAPETQNAFHVFITGGTWVPEGTGDPSVPDEDDCYYLCGGGFTGSANCAVSSL